MTDAGSAVLDRYELVVGVEVHAQLDTRTKLFCGCVVEFGAAPNTRTCPVCLGLPGVLPVLNAEAFEKALRLAVALGCEVAGRTEFDRKNYYYPDLPKNYQISQTYHELGRGGRLRLLRSGREVRMDNVHLEEDAGKLVHLGAGGSAVDLNRAGTPLAEIVTAPDFRTVEDVDDYMDTLTELLKVLGASRCRMQEGNLRFEASVSVRPVGDEALGERTEIKNLNSYAAVRRAVTWERARQVALLEAGRRPRQETRLWDEDERSPYEAGVPEEARAPEAAVRALLPDDWSGGRTRFMRSKEDAHDYRYFPEPDLPAVAVAPERVAAIRSALPELPGDRRARYADALGLAQKTAEALTRDPDLAAWFERVHGLGVPAADAANYALNQVAALLNARGLASADNPVPPEHAAELHGLIGELPKDLVLKQVWPKVAEEGLTPREVVRREGIEAVSADAVREAVDAAWAANPKAVAAIRAGKKKARGAIVGAVMKATKGQASPQAINARIDELAAEDG